jgi:hypothetical protein
MTLSSRVPIVFPWFGSNRHAPAAPQRGFARTATWHLEAVEMAGPESLTLTLSLGAGGPRSRSKSGRNLFAPNDVPARKYTRRRRKWIKHGLGR